MSPHPQPLSNLHGFLQWRESYPKPQSLLRVKRGWISLSWSRVGGRFTLDRRKDPHGKNLSLMGSDVQFHMTNRPVLGPMALLPNPACILSRFSRVQPSLTLWTVGSSLHGILQA